MPAIAPLPVAITIGHAMPWTVRVTLKVFLLPGYLLALGLSQALADSAPPFPASVLKALREQQGAYSDSALRPQEPLKNENLFRAPVAHGNDSKAEDFKAHYLLGDWGGVRTQLAEKGIKPSLLFISDPFGNPIGGRDQGFGVYNLLLADLVLETEPLLGWSDGEFHLGYAYTTSIKD